MNSSLAGSIAALRKKHGLSQEQLAEKLCVSRQAVSNWERGAAVPSLEMLVLMAQLFGVELSALVSGETAEAEPSRTAQPCRTALLPASAVLAALHFTLALLGRVDLLPVVLIPGTLVGLTALIHFTFRHVTAQNDLSIIAGFDRKRDDAEIVKKQLATIDLLNQGLVLLFNLLFFAMYSGPREGQLTASLIFLGAYVLGFCMIVVGVNLKMKSR